MAANENVTQLLRDYPLRKPLRWWYQPSSIVLSCIRCANAINGRDAYAGNIDFDSKPKDRHCYSCAMTHWLEKSMPKVDQSVTYKMPSDSLAKCTCLLDSLMGYGCKCGAKAPYVLKF